MLIKINENPTATAVIIGSKEYESIRGKADFYDTYGGTVIVVELYGLPEELEDKSSGFYGFHVHEGSFCTGNKRMLLLIRECIITQLADSIQGTVEICRRSSQTRELYGQQFIPEGFILRM